VKLSQKQFEAMVIEQTDLLYRMATRLSRDPQKAEDLVQETFLRALRGRDNFTLADYGVRPWLLRIMRNLHISRGEREARQPASADAESLENGRITDAELPIDPASFEAMDEDLVAAVNDLSEEYRTVLLLWAIEDFSYKEIADAVDIPLGTVMSRLHRARQQLASRLRNLARQTGPNRE
jgi:RNA polymerase sigma-70 factor, ECF subfamily